MNTRIVLSATCALALVGCDMSGTTQAGTSSETQSTLQALADSLVLVPGEAARPSASRKAIGTRTWSSLVESNLYFEYNPGPDHSVLRDETTLYRLQGDTSTYRFDSIFRIDRNARIEHRRIALKDESSSLDFEVRGETRAGFRFGSRTLTLSDVDRLHLDSARFFRSPWGGMRPAIYQFGSEWEVPVPLTGSSIPDSLPVFRFERLIGWMVRRTWGSSRPNINPSEYAVFDLDGNQFPPTPIAPRLEWEGDSLGLFFGKPSTDSQSGQTTIPYAWRFLPGTVDILRQSQRPFMYQHYLHSGCGTETELGSIPADDFFSGDSGFALSRWSGIPACADSGNRRFSFYVWARTEDGTSTGVKLGSGIRY